MSISELYSSGFRKRNRDHFAAIVRVALSDGDITPQEQAFLDRLAHNLDISQESYEEILANPYSYPVNAPHFHVDRLERLFDIARMVYVDHIEDEDELRMMRRLCIGLGFNIETVKDIVSKSLDLIHRNADLDTFLDELKHVPQH